MGYRIQYEQKNGHGRLYWLAAIPVLIGVAVYGKAWYWELAQYVGECIRGN